MTSITTEPEVLASERDGCLLLTINRPGAGNSLTKTAAAALHAALVSAEGRTDLRGIVLTGSGAKFFCSGGDIKAYRAIETKLELAETFGVARDLLLAIERHPVLVIAAINGYALGGGAELALAADLRIAAPGAFLGFPQSTLGIIPGWNGTERLVAAVGPSRATRMLLEASRLSATEALEAGLVDIVTSDQSAIERAVRYLAEIPAAPLAARAVKEAVRSSRPPLSYDATSEIFERLWFTTDHREAELAFAEKRKPVFVGR